MMQHIFLIVKPIDFNGWADAARDYHQGNAALQGIRDISEDAPGKKTGKKTGFSAKQWAQILGVKLPAIDPNAMDTRADRSHSYPRNKGSKGRVSSTKEDPETQRREGRCFTCNKQGHLSQNCPDKAAKTSDKGKVKARIAETEPVESENEAEPQTEDKAKTFVRLARSMNEEEKIDILMRVIEADKGAEGEDMDF